MYLLQFSNIIGNFDGKGSKIAEIVRVSDQISRRSVKDMANMFQQITEEKIQKSKQRDVILGRKENKQRLNLKEETLGILKNEESPSTNIPAPPVPSVPMTLTPPPPLPPLPPKQSSASESQSKVLVGSKIPVIVSIKPLSAQAPASPLPLPMVLDMTVTSGPLHPTDQLIPISVDTETEEIQSKQKVD